MAGSGLDGSVRGLSDWEPGAGMTKDSRKYPDKTKTYLLRIRIDDNTVQRMLRYSFSRDERLEDFIAMLLKYLFSDQPIDQMTRDLFKMWKTMKGVDSWPVVLQQEFFKLYPKKKHWQEMKVKLMARKKEMP
jgi:hypothetical protein